MARTRGLITSFEGWISPGIEPAFVVAHAASFTTGPSDPGDAVGLQQSERAKMHIKIHEDNSGALVLAQTIPPQFTPRSKHYAIKTHWFREQIIKRGIELLKIATADQLGDICTKCLPRAQFEYLRKKLMGW